MADALPIDAVLPELISILGSRGLAVLEAPPGAGKTTRVPLAILEAGLIDGRILMLEPRRLAARAAAERMAATLGEEVGGRVGYRIRGEAKVSRKTRIEVVTEGILTRMLQTDPGLSGIGAVIFDEFHERSLPSDLGLALCLEVRGALRDDLMLLVMSATLDGAQVAELMDAQAIRSDGRAFPDLAAVGVAYEVEIESFRLQVSGTSASCPVVAGIFALLNEARLRAGKTPLGFIAPLLYDVAARRPEAFRDIVKGNNGMGTQAGFDAMPGWDPVTGWGSPRVKVLLEEVLALP